MTPSSANAWKILLIGKEGQIGGELSSLLKPLGELIICGEEDLDLTQGNRIREKLRDVHPHVIVNAAAYTAVDQAEEEPDLALAVNGTAPALPSARAIAPSSSAFRSRSSNGSGDETDGTHARPDCLQASIARRVHLSANPSPGRTTLFRVTIGRMAATHSSVHFSTMYP